MKLAEELYEYFDKHFELKDEYSADTIYDVRIILNKHYNKPIDDCLDIIESLSIEMGSDGWHELGDLIDKLKAMKDIK